MAGEVRQITNLEFDAIFDRNGLYPEETALKVGCGACMEAVCLRGIGSDADYRITSLGHQISQDGTPFKYVGAQIVNARLDKWPEGGVENCAIDGVCPNISQIELAKDKITKRGL